MTAEGLKIAVIGGGSSYTPELVEGLVKRRSELPVADLWLVDVEAGRTKLEVVGALAQRMFAKAGVPTRVHLTLNRREAIEGADYVTTQLRVGQLAARAKDERIPLKYGVIGQETTGAGGFSKGLRTIPVILDICRDIEELAPDAWLMNFTNPAGMVTEAVLNHSKVRSIGLCNLPIETKMQIAALVGVTVDRVAIEMVGINHLNWTTKILIDGKDRTAEILFQAGGEGRFTMQNIPGFAWSPEFLKSLGALPCAYHRYYYLRDQMLQKQLDEVNTKGTRAEIVQKTEAELFALYRDPNLAVKPAQLEQRGGAYYSDAALNLISSIHNDKKDLQIVNVRNGGTLPFLPDGASIEVTCVVDAQGARPVRPTVEVGPAVRGLLQVVKAYEELSVKAAVFGDRDAALQALVLHPLVGSVGKAEPLLADLLEAHREFLPRFFGGVGK